MNISYILFVEDDDKIIDLMEIAVENWNSGHSESGRQFVLENCKTADQARIALNRTRYDAALFDLRLPGETRGRSTEPLGNELALFALEQLGIPVAIMSGNPGDLDIKLKHFSTVSLFFKGDKDAYFNAMEWFGGWWEMMAVIAGARQKIQQSSAEVFIKRLWPRWKDFASIQLGGEGHASLMDIVTRQYVSHMAELMGLDGPAGVLWHPFECYVIPSLWSHRAHTGDIFDFAGDIRIVLTPQCDMAQKNVKNVLLAKCNRGEQDWAQCITNLKNADTDQKREKAGKYFRKMITQQVGSSQHFLPPLPGETEPLMIDFSDLTVISQEQLNKDLLKRMASVSSPFLSNISQRFGAHASRVGQPNIDVMYFC